MKRMMYIMAGCLIVVGCGSPEDGGPFGEIEEALNGVLTSGGNLTRKALRNTDETARQNDTLAYYQHVLIDNRGIIGPTLSAGLPTLAAFRNNYGFSGHETVAYYYNRGDLGIGREMHCVDRMDIDGQVACYVRNFGAGDDGSEFTFGESTNIAFNNLEANHAFATVAMVFRDQKSSFDDKVFFAVYDGKENLSTFAALDRHGVFFNNEYQRRGRVTPDASFGVAGQTLNNHIPSNCISCHGGRPYDGQLHSETGSLFLPFDLDQFEYENAPGRSRAGQLSVFRTLNEMVRKVDALTAVDTTGNNVVAQLDGWYNNTRFSDVRHEVFEGNFDSTFVPVNWRQTQADIDVYRSVVRRGCRNCHMTNAKPFNTAADFASFAEISAKDLCGYQMPHALQSVREFWLSSAPGALEAYFRSTGHSSAADTLHACGPGNVITLDPPQIIAGVSSLSL